MKEKVVLILSGGMDSTTLLYELMQPCYDIYALSFDYNQKHSIELNMAEKTCKKLNINHKIINISTISELLNNNALTSDIDVPEGHYEDKTMKQTVVPNRNMILLSLAIGYAINIKAKKVFYGAHAGDHAIYPDCRKEFVNAIQKVAEICDYDEIKVIAPYLNMDKGDIAIMGKKLKVDYSLTYTCYKGNEKACGKCGACQERLEAFEKAGIKDPIQYE